METVAGDITIHATKTGMLANAAIVEAVAAAIAELDLPNLVVDPVMVAKSGDALLDADAVRAVCNELVPRARVVTPNIPEAEAMTGLRIRSLDDVRAAAARIREMGPTAVVIKGGHADGDDIVDLLLTADEMRELHVPRVHTRNTHGTGCTFASAIAALLAQGQSVPEAVLGAQTYVAGAIRNALAVGRGHGPLDHFWQTQRLS
jgi:hydroxymethylpyrimidine/phosphomethylpyrimidine kinase